MSVKSIVLKTVLGLAILAALVSAAVLIKNGDSKNAEKATEADSDTVEIYLGEEENVRKIEVFASNSFALYRNDDNEWVMEGAEGVKVKTAYADALAKSVASMSSPMVVCEECDDFAQYGLENPYAQIKVTYEDTESVINIGNESGDYYYFSENGEKKVYIISKQDLAMVFTDKLRYLDLYVADADGDDVVRVEYSNVVIKKSGDYWFEESPYSHFADASVVETEILPYASRIEASDVADIKEVSQNKIDTVKITLSDETEIELSVYPKDSSSFYVTRKGSDNCYVVKKSAMKFLNVTGFDIMTKYITPISLGEVEKIELVSPSATRVIEIEGADSEAPFFYLDDEEITEESAREFYRSLVSLSFKAEGKSDAAAEYAIIFTHTDKSVTDIRFLPYSATDYAVSIDGKTQFTVTKKSVRDVFASMKNIKTVY